MKQTAIIILTYNNCADTLNCIDSVEHYNSAPVKYIIVDNGSQQRDTVDDIDSYLSSRFKGDYLYLTDSLTKIDCPLPKVTFLASASNDGYACGNNKGLQLAYQDDDIDRVLVLNNDILFVDDIIPQLSHYQDTLPNCAIISPMLFKRDKVTVDYNCARNCPTINQMIKANVLNYWYVFRNKPLYNNSYLLNNPSIDLTKPFAIELPSGSCMLIKKDIFMQIGSFDPNTFLYYEENILYRRIQAIGMVNYISPAQHCIHLGAESTSKSPGLKIAMTAYDSQKYYVNRYERCSALKKALFNASVTFARLALRLQKKLYSRHRR